MSAQGCVICAWILDTDLLCYGNVANHTYHGSMKYSGGGTCDNLGGRGANKIRNQVGISIVTHRYVHLSTLPRGHGTRISTSLHLISLPPTKSRAHIILF